MFRMCMPRILALEPLILRTADENTRFHYFRISLCLIEYYFVILNSKFYLRDFKLFEMKALRLFMCTHNFRRSFHELSSEAR
jgi:hypothetical protein